MSTSASALNGIDPEALMRVVDPIALSHGVEVYDVEFRSEAHGWVLRVVVEKKGAAALGWPSRQAAVDLEICAAVSRDLSPALDVADLIPRAYHLEVGSPGLERSLRGERDFARFAGCKARIKIRQESGLRRVLVGALGGVQGDRVLVSEEGREHQIALSDIESARLVFEPGGGSRRSGRGAGALQQRKH